MKEYRSVKTALTDFTVKPGMTYSYTIRSTNQQSAVFYSTQVRVPPIPDVKISLKPGSRINNVKVTRRKTDSSRDAFLTINRNTVLEIEK